MHSKHIRKQHPPTSSSPLNSKKPENEIKSEKYSLIQTIKRTGKPADTASQTPVSITDLSDFTSRHTPYHPRHLQIHQLNTRKTEGHGDFPPPRAAGSPHTAGRKKTSRKIGQNSINNSTLPPPPLDIWNFAQQINHIMLYKNR